MVRTLITLLFAALPLLSLLAQSKADLHTREADKAYERMAYANAVEEYNTAASLGALNEHVVKRLADCYKRLGDTEQAERWYAQVTKFMNREPEDLYDYAQALKSNGKYAEAEEWMDRYLAMRDPDGQTRKSNVRDFVKKFTGDEDRFTVRPVSGNSAMTDMAPTWGGPDQVVFASSRGVQVGIQRRAAWNNESFLDLYLADVRGDGDLVNVRPVEGTVNTKQHEGPAVCDASGGTMWFTRSNPVRSSNGIHRLSLLKARRSGRGWSGVEPFLYNNPECSVGHPALSPDGRTLYFVSDMPGGHGGTDIYRCVDMGGQWGEPENLGPVINTERDELFPFVAADGALWFASEGHPGLGGLDIFAALVGADGSFTTSLNAGAPVNSPKDDFALIVNADNTKGYFTSNRPGGMGGDDLYVFEMHRPLEQRFLVSGSVVDDAEDRPVADVEVTLRERDGTVVASTRTDAEGKYAFPVQKDREYRVVARMPGRYNGEQHLSTEDIEKRQIVARDIHLVPDVGIWLRAVVRWKDRLGFVENAKVTVVNLTSFFSEVRTSSAGGDVAFRLQQNEQFEVLVELPGHYTVSLPVSTMGMKQGLIELGADPEKEIEMEPIVFGRPVVMRHVRWDGGSDKLDPLTKGELDQLAARMQVNPSLTVEVGVHSDARGDATAAEKLTQKRADAMVAYLRSKGVPKENLVAKGYGSRRPVNECGPGVQCTDAQHAENQRSEYTVLSGLR